MFGVHAVKMAIPALEVKLFSTGREFIETEQLGMKKFSRSRMDLELQFQER